MTHWHPIATAPRGRQVLLAFRGGVLHLGSYTMARRHPRGLGPFGLAEGWVVDGADCIQPPGEQFQPTHWAELPEPPADTAHQRMADTAALARLPGAVAA